MDVDCINNFFVELNCESVVECEMHDEEFDVEEVDVEEDIPLCFMDLAYNYLEFLIDELVILQLLDYLHGKADKAKA